MAIEFSLVGAVSDTSAKMSGRLSSAASNIQIEYADNNTFTGSTISGQLTTDSLRQIKFDFTGLTADTTYFYRYVEGGTPLADLFEFKTVVVGVAHDFTIGVGSCSKSISSLSASRLRDKGVTLTQLLGDTPYIDSEDLTGDTQRNAYFTWLARADVRVLLDKCAYSYVWDDHDFGLDNSRGDSPSNAIMQQVYREIFPSYNLADNQAIYYTYEIGRVKFIVLDLRSGLDTNTMMSAAQLTWFKQELTNYSLDNTFQALVVYSPCPWLTNSFTDSWNNARAQRIEVADFIENLGITNQMMMLSGDLHLSAFDDGTSNTFATSNNAGFPTGIVGPWAATGMSNSPDILHSEGFNRFDETQHTTLTSVDSGDNISLRFRSYDSAGNTGLIDYTLNITAGTAQTFNPAGWSKSVDLVGISPLASLDNVDLVITEANIPDDIFTASKADGADLRIAMNGEELPINVKQFSKSPNVAEIYVKTPVYTSTVVDRTITIYAGNSDAVFPAAVSEFGSASVFDGTKFISLDGGGTSAAASPPTFEAVGTAVDTNGPIEGDSTGIIGKATAFDGVNDRFRTGDLIIDPMLTDFYTSVWFYPTGSDTSRVLFDAFSSRALAYFRLQAGRKVAYTPWIGNSGGYAVSTTEYNPNQWNNAVLYKVQSGLATQRLNNVESATASHVTANVNSDLSAIGAKDAGPDQEFAGLISLIELRDNIPTNPNEFSDLRYKNFIDPVTFWTTGIVEDVDIPDITVPTIEATPPTATYNITTDDTFVLPTFNWFDNGNSGTLTPVITKDDVVVASVTGAGTFELTATYSDGTNSAVPLVITVNVSEGSSETSNLALNMNGLAGVGRIPNGTYSVDFHDATSKAFIATENVTFTDGVGSQVLSVPASTSTRYTIKTNTHFSGGEGVTA